MVMTDPIADLLTRIRNALMARKSTVCLRSSKAKVAILKVLEQEGLISGFEIVPAEPANQLAIHLKYGADGQSVIRFIERVSKPGCRIYRGAGTLKPVLRGQGLAVVSTPQGVMSDRECRRRNIGGEVLLAVW